jgi:YbbR domain-containing protein
VNEWARTWGLRLLALGIAIGIWFNASVEDRLVFSEKVVEAGIAYNRPRGFMVLSPVQNVSVRLSGSKKAIRQLSPYMVQVQVELSQRQVGLSSVTLESENVLLPDGLDVVGIEPRTIRVDLEKEGTQRVQVVPKTVGRPAAGSVVGEPEVLPSQVLVNGPEPMLARIKSISTRPVSLDGHALTFEESVEVISPDPLVQIVQPLRVTVRVPITPPGTETETPQPQQKKEKGKPT